ncbi:AfsR/SARP family transcriptional regulator [Streptomyces sp. NPDC004542]|uniref:AfsR/SARP family transcriptional regulator n=1 Tax=Streptomyces sp. NPDC004542 TaxID=3154281 RepID=UPI0033A35ADC
MSGAGPEFRVLGPVEVHDPRTGWRVVPPGAKQRVLLAVLVTEAGHTVTTERLADELWGHDPPRRAANAVQAHIARLRRLLHPPVTDAPLPHPPAATVPAHAWIATGPGGYVLRLGTATTDAERFRRLSAEGRAVAAEDPDRAAELLDRALSLWRGPALADCPGSAVCAAEADRLEEQRLTVLEALYEARLRSSRPEGVTGELERLAEEHPLRERFSDLLMVALHQADRRSEALAVYERVRLRLASELGVAPGPSLRGRREALLRHAPGPPPFPASPQRPGHAGGTDRFPERADRDGAAAREAEMRRIGRRLTELSRELRELTSRFEALAADRPTPADSLPPAPRR